jgi:hypothetical protein
MESFYNYQQAAPVGGLAAEMQGNPARAIVSAMPFSVKRSDEIATDILEGHRAVVAEIVHGLQRYYSDFITTRILPTRPLPGNGTVIEWTKTTYDQGPFEDISERSVAPLLRFYEQRFRVPTIMKGLAVPFEMQAVVLEPEGAAGLRNRLQVLANSARDTSSLVALQALAAASVRSRFYRQTQGDRVEIDRAVIEEARVLGGVQRDPQNFVKMTEELRVLVTQHAGIPGGDVDVVCSPKIIPYIPESGRKLGAQEGYSLGRELANAQQVIPYGGAQEDAAIGHMHFFSVPTPEGRSLDADNQAFAQGGMDSLLTQRRVGNFALVNLSMSPSDVYDGVTNTDETFRYRPHMKSYITFDFSTSRYVEASFIDVLRHALRGADGWRPGPTSAPSDVDPMRPNAPYFWAKDRGGVFVADHWLQTDPGMVPNEHLEIAARTLLARIADDCGTESLCEALRKTASVVEEFEMALPTPAYNADVIAMANFNDLPPLADGMTLPAFVQSYQGLYRYAFGTGPNAIDWRNARPEMMADVREVVKFWARAEELVLKAGESDTMISPVYLGEAIPGARAFNTFVGAQPPVFRAAGPTPLVMSRNQWDALRGRNTGLRPGNPERDFRTAVEDNWEHPRSYKVGGMAHGNYKRTYAFHASREAKEGDAHVGAPLLPRGSGGGAGAHYAGMGVQYAGALAMETDAAKDRMRYAKNLSGDALAWAFLVVCGQRCRDIEALAKADAVGQYIPIDIGVFRFAMTVETATMIIVAGGPAFGITVYDKPMITMQVDNTRRSGSYNATFRTGAAVFDEDRCAPAMGAVITRTLEGSDCTFMEPNSTVRRSLLAVPIAPGEAHHLPRVMHVLGYFPRGRSSEARGATSEGTFRHYGAARAIVETYDLENLFPGELDPEEQPSFYEVNNMPGGYLTTTTFHRTPGGKFVMRPGEDALSAFMNPTDAPKLNGMMGYTSDINTQVVTVHQGGLAPVPLRV